MRTSTLRLLAVALTAPGLLAVPLGAQTSTRQDSLTSTLEGRVTGRFDGASRPLAYAIVEAIGARNAKSAVADSLGRYRIEGLAPGSVRVRATHTGHDAISLTVSLPPHAATRVDLELTVDPLELPRVDVTGDPERSDPGEGRPEPLPEVELQALDLTPGVSQPGLLDAIRSMPGNDPSNATDVLYMRGSTTDLKLVLLDGVPVYTPFHVAGLMRSFEPSVLGRADLHVGGAPARYDGGLTHILDLGTRRARRDRVRGSGSIDLLSASVAAETPLGEQAGMIVSARSLHDLGDATLSGTRPYGYQDVLVTLDADASDDHRLRATGFWNAESVRLDWDRIPGDAEWSNRAGSLGYRGLLGPARVDVTAGASGYRAALPLQPSGDPDRPPPPAILASAAVDQVRIVAEAAWGPTDAPIRTGLSLDRIDAVFDAASQNSASVSEASTSTPGAFVDVTRPLAPGLTLRAGVRADLFDLSEIRLGPRAALHVDVGPDAMLSLAAGRYHQSTRTPDFEIERTLAQADGTLGPESLLPAATADHVVVSLDQLLGGRVRMGMEGFYKRFQGLATNRDETVLSSGVDIRLAASGEAGVAWLGYGLSWFWSDRDLSGRSSDFEGRHLLSAGASGALFGPFSAEARIAYGAGLPYTSVPFRGSFEDAISTPQASPGDQLLGELQSSATAPILGGLEEEFLRLDLELYALIQPEWGGRTWQVRPYLRVLNALDRRDALFYTYRRWQPDSVRPLAEQPLLPLLGVSFSF